MSVYVDASEIDPLRDIPNRREIPIKGNKIIMERRDPFGFWSIWFDKGRTPDALGNSVYTSDWEAERAINAFLIATKRELEV